MLFFVSELYKNHCMMKYFLHATLFAYFVAAFANSSVKPTTSPGTNKAYCNVNNNYNSFYAGPNCKKIEQQLAKMRSEILEEVRTLKRNERRRVWWKRYAALSQHKFHFFTAIPYLPKISHVNFCAMQFVPSGTIPVLSLANNSLRLAHNV